MRIFISEADRQDAHRIALKNIARFFNITGWESKTNEELLEGLSSLRKKNVPPIVKLLNEYLKAYDEWFLFYNQRKIKEEKSGREYILTDKDRTELTKLIQERQNKLRALQQKFDELQLDKFHNKMGMKNMRGIIHHEQ